MSEVGRDLLSCELVEISSVFCICVSKLEVVNHCMTLDDFSDLWMRMWTPRKVVLVVYNDTLPYWKDL